MIRHVLTLPRRTWLAGSGALLVSLALARLAAVSPRLAVGGALVILLVTVVMRSLLTGVVIFIVLTFPTSLPSSLGTATIAKPLGLIIMISWLLRLAARRDERFLARDQPLLAAAVLAYTVWATASAVWAIDPAQTLASASRLVQVVILLFIVYSSVRTTRDLRVIGWAYLLAASATSAYALASGVAAGGRLTGGIANPNFLASELVVAIMLGLFILAAATNSRERAAVVVLVVTCVAAFVRTESREGMIALLLTILGAALAAGRRGVRRLGDVAPEVSVVARGLLVGTVGLLVTFAFGSDEYEKQPWILLGLLAAIPAVVAGARREREHGRPDGAVAPVAELRPAAGPRWRCSPRPESAGSWRRTTRQPRSKLRFGRCCSRRSASSNCS